MSDTKIFACLMAVWVAFTLMNPSAFAKEKIYSLEEHEELRQNAKEYFDKGNGYLDSGQYDNAINEFTQAIELQKK